jgi:hypothetical protein
MVVPVDRSRSLPESKYFPDGQAKTAIALHHTACDSAHTTLDIWRRYGAGGRKPQRLAAGAGVIVGMLVNP